MRIGAVVIIVWLIIGALAAGQRGYFANDPENCAEVSTTAVTIVAGPLNYVGSTRRSTARPPSPPSDPAHHRKGRQRLPAFFFAGVGWVREAA